MADVENQTDTDGVYLQDTSDMAQITQTHLWRVIYTLLGRYHLSYHSIKKFLQALTER